MGQTRSQRPINREYSLSYSLCSKILFPNKNIPPSRMNKQTNKDPDLLIYLMIWFVAKWWQMLLPACCISFVHCWACWYFDFILLVELCEPASLPRHPRSYFMKTSWLTQNNPRPPSRLLRKNNVNHNTSNVHNAIPHISYLNHTSHKKYLNLEKGLSKSMRCW